MHATATTALLVAIAGVAVGAVGIGLAWWSAIRVRRVRDAQRTMIGGGRRDLVDFAVSLQGRIDDLHREGHGDPVGFSMEIVKFLNSRKTAKDPTALDSDPLYDKTPAILRRIVQASKV